MEYINYAIGAVLIWNMTVFFLYTMDKYRARNAQWRVAEKALLLCALLGGGIGGLLGMQLLRHKTRHLKFRILLPVAFVLTAALLAYLVWIRD